MIHPKILIVEDREEDATELKNFLEKHNYEVSEVATNLKDALGYYYAQKPDLVVADIYLNGQPDGITFAERVQENPNTARPIIFLTSHTDQDTFNKARLTVPLSYLIKPFNELELQYALELAVEKFGGLSGALTVQNTGVMLDKDLFIKVGNTLMKVPMHEIDFVEVQGKYCSLAAGDTRYLVQQPLKKLEEKLLPGVFVKVHRNYIVNSNAMKKVLLADNVIVLKSNKTIPFSNGMKDSLLKTLDILK